MAPRIMVPTLSPAEASGTYAPRVSPFAPTGAIAESCARNSRVGEGLSVLSSGRLQLVAIPLVAGQVVNSLSFLSSGTAAGTSTHVWFALYSPARALLAVTNDDTAASPWAINTVKTMNLTTPYTVTATGLYYMGVVVVAGTVPTLQGMSGTSTATGIAPIITGQSSTGLTDPASAPATAAAITAIGGLPYCWASGN